MPGKSNKVLDTPSSFYNDDEGGGLMSMVVSPTMCCGTGASLASTGRGRKESSISTELPGWMSQTAFQQTQELALKAKSSGTHVSVVLRGFNRKQQLDQEVWTSLYKMFMLNQDPTNPDSQRKLKAEMAEVFRTMEESEKIRDVPGPVGDLPMHACFLLQLEEVGKEIVERFYSPELRGRGHVDINTPYASDLSVWKRLGVLDRNDPCDDGGLYTGETCLHISIVQYKAPDLCRWMVSKGAKITARATGAFFKPPFITKIRNDDNPAIAAVPIGERRTTLLQRLRSWVTQYDLNREPHATRRKLPNPFSACDYGEYPLSFAASVGSVAKCEILVQRSKQMPPDEEKEFLKEQMRVLQNLDGRCNGIDCEHWHQKHQLLFHKNKKNVANLVEEYCLFTNAQDSVGNTALHMAVFHKQMAVVDWLMNNGGRPSLSLLNAEGLTPFTLAAKKGYTDMVYHILHRHMMQVEWSYGEVRMSKMSLEQLDSFRVKGNPLHEMPNWRSAIEIIVEHEVVEFSKDDLFNKLITEKWQNFGRRKYTRSILFPYLVFLTLFTSAVTIRCYELRARWGLALSGDVQLLDGEPVQSWAARVGGMHPNLSDQMVQESIAALALHVVLAVIGVPWLVWQGWAQRRLGKRDLDPEDDGRRNYVSFIFKNMTFMLNFASSGTLVVSFVSRFAGDEELELDSWAVACVLCWVNLLTLIVPFQFFGPIIITMYRMLIGDILQFFSAYLISTVGFSLAIFVLFQQSEFPDDIDGMDIIPAYNAIIAYFWISLSDSVDLLEYFERARNFDLLLALHLVYIVLTTLLLLNLLIAMMGQTFERNAEDTHRTWIFPFASLVLRYEKLLTDAERSDKTGRFRSGKFAGADGGLPEDDPHAHWRSVFYEIDVGVSKIHQQEGARVRAYEDQHSAILASLEDSVGAFHAGVNKSAETLEARLTERLMESRADMEENFRVLAARLRGDPGAERVEDVAAARAAAAAPALPDVYASPEAGSAASPLEAPLSLARDWLHALPQGSMRLQLENLAALEGLGGVGGKGGLAGYQRAGAGGVGRVGVPVPPGIARKGSALRPLPTLQRKRSRRSGTRSKDSSYLRDAAGFPSHNGVGVGGGGYARSLSPNGVGGGYIRNAARSPSPKGGGVGGGGYVREIVRTPSPAFVGLGGGGYVRSYPSPHGGGGGGGYGGRDALLGSQIR